MSYNNTQDLGQFMNIISIIPDRSSTGSARLAENVGSNVGTTSPYFTDKSYLVSGTLVLSYGTDAAKGTTLTEGTDYSQVNYDDGQFYLTDTGSAKIESGQSIFAKYSYVSENLTDTQLQQALDRANADILKRTQNGFFNGTASTPGYSQVTNEEHAGRGMWDKGYYLEHYPLPNVSTTLTTSLGSAETGTANVQNTNGFGSSGVLGIGSEKITYTSKNGSAFIGLGRSGSSDIGTASTVNPYVIEISNTDEGSNPVWQVLSEGDEFNLDKEPGKVYLYATEFDNTYWTANFPKRLVPNRFRASYIWGESSIPNDIKRCELMMAARDMMRTIVRQKHTEGMNDYNPSLLDIDKDEIDRIISEYQSTQNNNV